MQNKINTILTAAIGTSAVEVTQQMPIPSTEDVQNIGQLIIQVLIGIVTLWKMLKKPKPKQDSNDFPLE
jgi:hypothetical protein